MSFKYPILDYRVIDGDTVEVFLDRGWGDTKKLHARLMDIDAPDSVADRLLTKDAKKAVTDIVYYWMYARFPYLEFESVKKDKYDGRGIGHIYPPDVPSANLSTFLLTHQLVREYQGQKKEPWLDEELQAVIDRCASVFEGGAYRA